jgi:hypothetical protein
MNLNDRHGHEPSISNVLSESTAIVCNNINNDAISSIQNGKFKEARESLVTGLGILHEFRQEQAVRANKTTTTFTTNRIDATFCILGVGSTCTSDNNDNLSTHNIIDSISMQDFCQYGTEEQLQLFPYFNTYFYIPTIDNTSSVTEIFVVILFNVCMTYQKEGIEGRSVSFHRALYTYRRLLLFIIATSPSIITNTSNKTRGCVIECALEKRQFSSSLCLVALATCHNMGCIYKEIGQPKLYRTLIEMGEIFKNKMKSTISDKDQSFFGLNRFFARYYEHSCAKAA